MLKTLRFSRFFVGKWQAAKNEVNADKMQTKKSRSRTEILFRERKR